MQVACPTCSTLIELNGPPAKGPDQVGNKAWECMKCKAVICEHCYYVHTKKEHPKLYEVIKKK